MTRTSLIGTAATVAAALTAGLVALSVSASPVHAQVGTPPPFPIVYRGEVYVDGVLLSDREARLTVRVGDWESRPGLFSSSSGRLLSLVAGPPDHSYIGLTITFHLGDVESGVLEASQQFVFPALGQPRLETIRLDFTSAQDGGSAFPWAAVGGGVGGGGLAILTVLALRLWRRARPGLS